MDLVGAVQKCFSAFQLCYQNKSCSECQQDVKKTEKHAQRQTDRQTDGQTERQSKQKLFRMSTGLQKDRKTCQQKD